jgi:hypothetical protein
MEPAAEDQGRISARTGECADVLQLRLEPHTDLVAGTEPCFGRLGFGGMGGQWLRAPDVAAIEGIPHEVIKTWRVSQCSQESIRRVQIFKMGKRYPHDSRLSTGRFSAG